MKIEEQAKEILKLFPQIKEQPASLSGRFHIGETVEQHLERVASVMRHLCDGFHIYGNDRDMLIACAYLHDLGIYVITKKGKIDMFGWTYHESGWSRMEYLMKIHPVLSAHILDEIKLPLDRKHEIKRIVSIHMGKWYRSTPKPENLYEYLLVIADYLSNRKQGLFDYHESREKSNT